MAALLTGILAGQFAGQALVVSAPVATPDAILTLASHEWERLPAAAELAARFPSSLVLLTIPVYITEHSCHDCSNRAQRLIWAGVAADRIRMVETTRQGTYGEAQAARRYVQALNVRRLLVVTSPYHARRTLAVFRTVLSDLPVEVGVFPASRYSPARPRRWWLAAYDRNYVAYEWAALVYYAFKHGVPPLVSTYRPGSATPKHGTLVRNMEDFIR